MGTITLKNRLGGTISFGGLNEFNDNYWGILRRNMTSDPGEISFTPFTQTRWETWCTIAPTNSGGIWTAGINTYGPLYNYPYSLEIETANDYVVMANIVLVEPGQNTQSHPGYSLKISGYKEIVAVDPNNLNNIGYNARVKFEIWTIAGETLIATIDPFGNGQNSIYFFWSDVAGIVYGGEALDLKPRLILLNDGTNLYFLIEAVNYIWYRGGAAGFGLYGNTGHTLFINDDILKNVWQLTDSDSAIEDVEINPEYGTYSKPGGYTGQSFDDSSDPVPLPTVPTFGVTNSGFIHLYKVLQSDLENLGGELFPAFPDGTDVLGALNTLAKIQTQQNLINYVQDCRILPVRATSTGTLEGIKLAGKTLNTQGEPVTQDYVDFDCGELEVGERYVNFADYEPFTMAKLYLPFVGFVPIAMEYVSGGSLHIIYRFNLMDGSFVAYVKATSSKSELTDSVIAQYGGNCCVHMPITGLNYATMVTGIVGGAMQMVSGVGSMSAGLGQVAQGIDAPNHSRMLAGSGLTLAGYGIGSMTSGVNSMVGGLADILSAKPDYQQSNNYNATTSFLTVRKPYLLIGRPVPQFSSKYPEENGLPLNVTKKLGDCSGFTKVGACILEGIECTDSEKDMIQSYLNSGVII